MLKDNAVVHHFQHICAVFFGVMMVSIYLSHTLNSMTGKGWIDEATIFYIFSASGFVSVIFWFLWFTRTKDDNLFDITYRVFILLSGVIAAILGRIYVGV